MIAQRIGQIWIKADDIAVAAVAQSTGVVAGPFDQVITPIGDYGITLTITCADVIGNNCIAKCKSLVTFITSMSKPRPRTVCSIGG